MTFYELLLSSERAVLIAPRRPLACLEIWMRTFFWRHACLISMLQPRKDRPAIWSCWGPLCPWWLHNRWEEKQTMEKSRCVWISWLRLSHWACGSARVQRSSIYTISGVTLFFVFAITLAHNSFVCINWVALSDIDVMLFNYGITVPAELSFKNTR